jgi:glycosyltransferase involved in cell wall biosynthesis
MLVAGLDIGNSDGGAERSGLDLALNLDRTLFAPTVCAFWRTGSAIERRYEVDLANAGVHLVYATAQGAKRNSADARHGLSRICALVLGGNFALAHAHHEGGALGIALARLAGARCSVLRSMHMPLHLQWGIGAPAVVQRLLFSHLLFPIVLNAEVAITPWYARGLNVRWVSRALRKPVEMIYNARTVAVVAPRAHSDPLRWRIGTVGRLVEQKRPDVLLEALPQILADSPGLQAELVFVGDGPLRSSLEQRVKQLGIAAHVHFLGQRDDALDVLTAFDLFVLPSDWEGLPNVLLEAISLGVPAIVSNIAGSTDLIQHGVNGRVFERGSSQSLAEQVSAAIRDTGSTHRMARQAQSVLPEFSVEHAVQHYQSLYGVLLSRSARRATVK